MRDLSACFNIDHKVQTKLNKFNKRIEEQWIYINYMINIELSFIFYTNK